MPSRMRSLFKRKNKKNTNNHDVAVKDLNGSDRHGGDDRSTPIDPDGSTASHDSNEIYLSNNQQQQQQQQQDPSTHQSNSVDNNEQDAAVMTASQFKSSSDSEMEQRRMSQPDNSPHHAQPKTSKLNSMRSRQGRNCNTKSREGVPIITSSGADHFSPSAVRSGGNYATEGFYSKSKQMFGGKSRPKTRPSARSSAFGGAPRYDWMDIETTAATKIQANYRRVQTLNYLDAQNLSTPGMRNRRARLQARYKSNQSNGNQMHSADVPFPFNLCGVGLLFGDGTFEDEAIVNGLEKRRVKERKRGEVREDEEKRRFRMRKKESQHLEEGIEVVESFDAEEEGDEDEVGQSGRGRSSRNKSSSRSRSKSKGRSSSKKFTKSQNDDDDEEEEGAFL
mmetsp:Transcript_9162/g.20694  ORF Transcript_9162/g.20694 Transcript_9162/m.20694 type:complete len:392 (-) Transcript_9162:143-1318(-)